VHLTEESKERDLEAAVLEPQQARAARDLRWSVVDTALPRRALVARARAPTGGAAAGSPQVSPKQTRGRSDGLDQGGRKVQTQCKHAPRHSTKSQNRAKAQSSAIEPNRRTQRHPTTPPKWAHNPKVAGSNPAPAMTPLATMPARSSRSEVVLKALDTSAFSRISGLFRSSSMANWKAS
jgi:hypothetical protein